jgi:hypothetical protein
VADEASLMREIEGVEQERFRFYVINQSTIISMHEATAINVVSKGGSLGGGVSASRISHQSKLICHKKSKREKIIFCQSIRIK